LGASIPVLALNTVIYFLFKRTWIEHGAVGGAILFNAVLAAETVTVLVAVLALYLVAVHRISGPYINLIRTLDRINGGDRDARIRFRAEDRLDDVASAFNAALDRLTRAAGR
jgi:methyl-accepting chemotaxis protein